ncbi:MAG TPA: glycoside hydrolase family 43 protein [Kofleriaceae bacterium]|nr:glycoside hydrolase family 43 protein [Kofleriaceae bacterium]
MRPASSFGMLILALAVGCGGDPDPAPTGDHVDARGGQSPDAGSGGDPTDAGAMASTDASPPVACQTRITYGAAWIHPDSHPASEDIATGQITWDGVCHTDGANSYAVLSNGWKPYFTGASGCIIALDVTGDCDPAPAAACRTRITYGPAWDHPAGHSADYDQVNGVVTWDGVCHGGTHAVLSNGWAPYYSGTNQCAVSLRYEQCGGLYQNPVVDKSCADPGVTKDGDRYVMVCTSGNAAAAFPIRTSRDLVHWKANGHVFSAEARSAWADGDFWAPEIHRVGDHWVVYFSARNKADGKLAVGAGTATDILGPYTDIGHPLVHDPNPGVIDASYVEDGDKHYLLWKVDGNAVGAHTPIRIQQLDAAGTGLLGSPKTILTNDRSWEGPLVEGPWMIHHGDYFYLFYSGNGYASTAYAIGVARAASPLGPFTKLGDPILTSNAAWSGPGHGSVIVGPRGEWVHIYHAWVAGHVGEAPGRLVLADRISWRDGWPHMDSTPSPRSVPVP